MISLTVKMAEQNKKKGCLLEHSQEGPHDCTGVALGNSCLAGKSRRDQPGIPHPTPRAYTELGGGSVPLILTGPSLPRLIPEE